MDFSVHLNWMDGNLPLYVAKGDGVPLMPDILAACGGRV